MFFLFAAQPLVQSRHNNSEIGRKVTPLHLLVMLLFPDDSFICHGISQPSGWQGFSLVEAAQGWASYLAYGLPCVAMVCLEWWVWEVRGAGCCSILLDGCVLRLSCCFGCSCMDVADTATDWQPLVLPSCSVVAQLCLLPEGRSRPA